MSAPIAISTPAPEYTQEALEAGIQGTVILEAAIDCRGRVIAAEVIQPLPLGLSEAAVDAALTWRFQPAMLNGRPVAVLYNLVVSFRLD